MKKIFVTAFLSLFVYFFSPTNVFAADMNVTCPITPSGCSIDGTNPLFTAATDGVWYPGRILAKSINMKNGGAQTREMALKGTGTGVSDTLKNVMNLSLISSGGTVVWSGSLADFYNLSSINLGIFAPGANLDYNMTVNMDSSANNDYQGRQSVFDLTLGFWGEPVPIPTSTPTSTPAPGTTPTPAPAVLGAGVSAPVCNDTTPGGAPTLISAIGGVNSVTLTWSKASDPVTYYLVAYGVSPNDQTYGNPNIGGKNTTSYTVGGLSAGGTTYCFVVRAGNGCQTGPFSTPLCTTPGGVTVAGIAPGFTPGVLGTQTQQEASEPALATSVPEVAGVSTCQDNYYPWWIPLVVQAVIALVLIYIARKKKWSVKAFGGISFIVAIISQVVHELLGCNCATGYWCPKYIFINLIILGLAVLTHYRAISLKK